MPKRGRKPIPPELRKGKRKIEGTAKAVDGRPDCPDHLDDVGRAKWDHMVGLLAEMGVLSRTDADAIALYCESYSGWRRCLDKLREPSNMTVVTAKGFELPSPWVTMRNNFAREMARLLAEFGMTPSSRSRVAAPKPEEDGPLVAFLKRGQ